MRNDSRLPAHGGGSRAVATTRSTRDLVPEGSGPHAASRLAGPRSRRGAASPKQQAAAMASTGRDPAHPTAGEPAVPGILWTSWLPGIVTLLAAVFATRRLDDFDTL